MEKIIAIALLMTGCASPNAWQDLGDGAGMRGWAGVPLKYTAPLAPLAPLAALPRHEYHRHSLQPMSAFTTYNGNTSYTTYSGF